MPDIRPGQSVPATATKAVLHGAPCIENNIPGIALKQVAAPAGTGLGDAKITTVQVGEQFAIQCKGRVYVSTARQEGGNFAVGDAVYIIPASNLLTAVSTSNAKYGRVVEIGPNRGIASGKCRIDLDLKNTI